MPDSGAPAAEQSGETSVIAALIQTVAVIGAWTTCAEATSLLERRHRESAILFADSAFVLDHGVEPATIPGGFAAVRLFSAHARRHEGGGVLVGHGLRLVPGPQFVDRRDHGFELVVPVLPEGSAVTRSPHLCRPRFVRRP